MPALLLGVMTAVGGGMIRDVSAGSVPMVFGGNNLYATPAVVASLITIGFFYLNVPMLGMLVATVVGSAFTVVAHWRKWRLPSNPDWTLDLRGVRSRFARKSRREEKQN